MFRLRILRPLLVLAVLVGAFDSIVTLAIDAAWFSSVNLGGFWRTQLLWKTGICSAFVVFCLIASVGLMRCVARPVVPSTTEPPLPRALERWQPLRSKALRLGWLVLALWALVLGQNLGNHWSDFALWSTRGQSKDVTEFWLVTAPPFSLLLDSFWKFALVAALVTVVVGALRALPFLAARPSVRPVRWLRSLTFMGSLLLLLRALGYLYETAWHAQVADENALSRSLFITICMVGALGCFALLPLLLRPRSLSALWGAIVFLLPSLLGDLLAPFAGRGAGTPQLPSPLLFSDQVPTVLPLGDEATLLRSARLHLSRDKGRRLIAWENAALSTLPGGGEIKADIVGTPLVGDSWMGHGFVDVRGDLTWRSFNLPEFSPSKIQPLGPLFFGPDARPLISEEKDSAQPGVSVESWIQKLAWAWRLRDPVLIVDGERAKRLLVWRGAQEVGRKLAPFWTWDTAVPRRDPRTGAAYFECVAYSSTVHFPHRAPLHSGVFAGKNAVFPVAVLQLDSRLGEVRLAPFSGSTAAKWQNAIPSLFTQTNAQEASTTALQNSLAAGWPLLWTRTFSNSIWQRKAIPVEYQAKVRKKLIEFTDDVRTHSLDGATPILWQQDKVLWMAQPFFQSKVAKEQNLVSPTNDLSIPFAGVVLGPLEESGVGWGRTLSEARINLKGSASVPPSKVATPSYVSNAVRELVRAALESQKSANQALREGRYVESQRASERTNTLLQQLERQTR